MYLDTIKSALKQINDELGLRVAENRVVYKVDGKREAFNYDRLIKAQNRGMESLYSEAHDDLIPIAQILRQTAYRKDQTRQQLILDVVRACRKMQDNRDRDEDGRTTYIRDILGEKYEILDQTRGGRSELGKSAGELDLKILREHGVPWTIF